MRWIPFESWQWQTRLSAKEVHDRLKQYVTNHNLRKPELMGAVSEAGFHLTPAIWGQTSFLPRIIGRWQSSPMGTRVDVDVAPNIALQLSLVILFAFFGILVYDSRLERVIVTTCASTFLAWVWLLVGHEVGVSVAERRLKALLDSTPAPKNAEPLIILPSSKIWLVASWSGIFALVVTGIVLLRLIYDGILVLTMRPAIDIITVYWTTQSLTVIWLFWLSGIRPRTQTVCLFLFFVLEIGWIWCLVVDGFGGDGRPMLAWRWARAHGQNFVLPKRRSDTVADHNVDLMTTGPHDFAEFRGSRRDGVVSGVSLNTDWNHSPPEIIWKQPIGIGWSAFSIIADFAVTHEQRGPDEAVVCYDLITGVQRWEHRDRALFHEMMGGDGPRATPTIHDGKVYALGATGILNCLDGRNGQRLWSTNVVTENHAPTSLFGMTGSPLIWRDLVIVAPGGPDASVVAYDRNTGKRKWGMGSAEAAYAAPQLATLGGTEQVLCFNAEGIFSHAPEDGRILWSFPWVTPPERNNVCQPIVWIDDQGRESVFIASGYGKGCALLDVNHDADGFIVKPRWHSTQFRPKFASAVERNGYVYGLDENILCCIDLKTGDRCWKRGRYGFGQLLLVESHLLVLSDEGEIVLCEATPTEHRELARCPVLNGRTWNHPAISGDRMLIRNDRAAAHVRIPFLTTTGHEE